LFKRTRKVLGKVIDLKVNQWIAFDYLKSNTTIFMNWAKNVFIPQNAVVTESFENSLIRLSISEADLLSRQQELRRLFLIHLMIAVLVLLYLIFLLVKKYLLSSLLCFSILLVSVSLVFRYHFWLFQIKKRKLGCSLSEWWNS
jgi:intracellular multiplication protein IcmV